MDSNFSGSSIKGLANQPYAPISKDLTHPGAGGAGAAGGGDSALAQWYDQAVYFNNWYQGVISGQIQLQPGESMPTDAEYQGFLQQLQWASGTLGYAQPGWDPGMGQQGGPMGPMGPMGPGGPMQPGQQSNQFGGISGTMDNWVYTSGDPRIGFTGTGTHDIFLSGTFTLDIAPTSANVVVENTTDSRFGQSESVVKITVTDPATNCVATYFVHDYDPATDKIKINTPDSATQVVNNTGDASITTGKFAPGGAGAAGAKPDASIEGAVQTDGTILYEPEFAGGTIDFWANPGESQTHIVYSDANISVKPSDQVNVSMDTDGVMVVTVNHTTGEHAGTTDTYKIQKGYKGNVNVNAEYITYGTPPVSSDTVPTDLAERLTINGGVSADGAATGATADAIVSALLDATGRTENQMITALKTAGYNYNTIAEFKKAITDKEWPPEQPDQKLVDFLRRIDGDLATDVTELLGLQSVTDDSKDSQKKTLTENIHERLATLLQTLYPDSIITAGAPAPAFYGGAISINGTDFNWALNSTTGEIDGSME